MLVQSKRGPHTHQPSRGDPSQEQTRAFSVLRSGHSTAPPLAPPRTLCSCVVRPVARGVPLSRPTGVGDQTMSWQVEPALQFALGWGENKLLRASVRWAQPRAREARTSTSPRGAEDDQGCRQWGWGGGISAPVRSQRLSRPTASSALDQQARGATPLSVYSVHRLGGDGDEAAPAEAHQCAGLTSPCGGSRRFVRISRWVSQLGAWRQFSAAVVCASGLLVALHWIGRVGGCVFSLMGWSGRRVGCAEPRGSPRPRGGWAGDGMR